MFDIPKSYLLCFILIHKLNSLMHITKTWKAFKLYYLYSTKINRFILWYNAWSWKAVSQFERLKVFNERMENVHTEVLCREMKKIKIEYLILQFLLDAYAKEFWSTNVPFYFFTWWMMSYTTQLWYKNMSENAL